MTIADIKQQLRRDEGEVPHAYQDHLGFWTIGVGRLIDKRKGGGITEEESEFLLDNDIAAREAALLERLPWIATLSSVRRGALLNMSFQMGVTGLLAFKNTLAMVKAKDYAGAAKGMLQSKWAEQTPERAHRISEQMRLDAWQ